jgi:hypothetical protein
MDRPRRPANNAVYRQAIDDIRLLSADERKGTQRRRRKEVCLY